jgi:ubiquitin C-terminal hydrolase
VGLVNIGNSCYINTTLQILSKIETLRNEILKYLPPPKTEKTEKKDEIVIESKNVHLENSSFDLLSCFSVILDKLNTNQVVSIEDISNFKSSCGRELSLKYYSNEQQGKKIKIKNKNKIK